MTFVTPMTTPFCGKESPDCELAGSGRRAAHVLPAVLLAVGQRLDPWHALQHLWTVAHALHPQDEAAAAAWIAPLKEKLLASQAVEIMEALEEVIMKLRGPRRATVQAERNYLEHNRERLDYHGVQERGEPGGSEAMESTCKQYQVRFHRSGQF